MLDDLKLPSKEVPRARRCRFGRQQDHSSPVPATGIGRSNYDITLSAVASRVRASGSDGPERPSPICFGQPEIEHLNKFRAQLIMNLTV